MTSVTKRLNSVIDRVFNLSYLFNKTIGTVYHSMQIHERVVHNQFWNEFVAVWKNLTMSFRDVFISEFFTRPLNGKQNHIFYINISKLSIMILEIKLSKHVANFTIIFWLRFACWKFGHFAKDWKNGYKRRCPLI